MRGGLVTPQLAPEVSAQGRFCSFLTWPTTPVPDRLSAVRKRDDIAGLDVRRGMFEESKIVSGSCRGGSSGGSTPGGRIIHADQRISQSGSSGLTA